MKKIRDAILIVIALKVVAGLSQASEPVPTDSAFSDSGQSKIDLNFLDSTSVKSSDLTVADFSSLGEPSKTKPVKAGSTSPSKSTSAASVSSGAQGDSTIISDCDELCAPGEKPKRRVPVIAGPLTLLAIGGIAWGVSVIRSRVKG